MDANGLNFWLFANADHWAELETLDYDRQRRSLRLSSERPATQTDTQTVTEDRAIATQRLTLVPQTRDGFGTRAYWDEETRQVMAVGVTPDPVPIYPPAPDDPNQPHPALPEDQTPTDLAMGYDGVLYMASANAVVMIDVRDRWDAVTLSLGGFSPWRLAAAPDGGVWVLGQPNLDLADNSIEASVCQIGRVSGLPYPRRPFAPYAADVFRPCEENPNPPRLTQYWSGPLENERGVAIASSPTGQVLLLTWQLDEQAFAQVRYVLSPSSLADPPLSPPILLNQSHSLYSLAWVTADRIALMLAPAVDTPTEDSDSSNDTPIPEAVVYALPAAAEVITAQAESSEPRTEPIDLNPVGDFYPLRQHTTEPFTHGVDLPPHYPTTVPGPRTQTNPLYPLSQPRVAPQGESMAQFPCDSQNTQTIWHRLYLEAVIPPGCGIQVFLAATDQNMAEGPESSLAWHEHRFGHISNTNSETDSRHIPKGTWMTYASEIPHHTGLLDCPLERDRSGLFTVLIQRSGLRVRSLTGRYLWVKVVLRGNGRATPELAALRVYSSRFSYVEQYLPELYHETVFGPERDDIAPSTPADFLERFLGNMEGFLTPLEDRIAYADLLTDPRTTLDESLAWLGAWLGVAFDPIYPEHRRRQLLQATPQLYRRRGTLQGLKLALNVATGGGVNGGEIIVLENFRLRRTFATILGAHLTDPDDPLLQGLSRSGNSFVGDSLILGERPADAIATVNAVGEELQTQLLALFGIEAPMETSSNSNPEEIAQFFDQLAYRATVFVHQAVTPQDLGLIQRIVEMETPAHVDTRVITASQPLMVGIASLVGVDTYLGPRASPQPVRLNDSAIGLRDTIQRPASLDPRLQASGIP
ncbi:MAG: phage tail protein [Leptolyngbyaceae cyanobacterium]